MEAVLNTIKRKNHQLELRKILYREYGIKIKTIHINDTKSYFGTTYYLPYYIIGWNDEDRDDLAVAFWERKIYRSLDEILEKAQNGELELI